MKTKTLFRIIIKISLLKSYWPIIYNQKKKQIIYLSPNETLVLKSIFSVEKDFEVSLAELYYFVL